MTPTQSRPASSASMISRWPGRNESYPNTAPRTPSAAAFDGSTSAAAISRSSATVASSKSAGRRRHSARRRASSRTQPPSSSPSAGSPPRQRAARARAAPAGVSGPRLRSKGRLPAVELVMSRGLSARPGVCRVPGTTCPDQARPYLALRRRPMAQAFLIGRILVGCYYLQGAYHHFTGIGQLSRAAAAHGVPAPEVAVIGAGVLLLVAGLSFLLGVFPRLGVG